jgi:hypothetical protein
MFEYPIFSYMLAYLIHTSTFQRTILMYMLAYPILMYMLAYPILTYKLAYPIMTHM